MNGTYYPNPTFPTAATNNYQEGNIPVGQEYSREQNTIENILKLNKGKKVKIYMSYPNTNDEKKSSYSGIIEQAGKEHLILSNPETGNWYLLLTNYLDYTEFEEKIIF